MKSTELLSRGYVRTLLVQILLVVLPCVGFAQKDVIDRILAVVNGEIITLSDLRTETTMREILGEPPAKNDRELLDELIDQHIIHAYLGQYPNANPSKAELDEAVSVITDTKGLPIDMMRNAIREHLRVQFFIETFGQSIRTSELEIQEYYDEVFVPAQRARGSTSIPALSEIVDRIRANVVDQKRAAEVKRWLEHARIMANIQIFE
jgi:hypothetical protein